MSKQRGKGDPRKAWGGQSNDERNQPPARQANPPNFVASDFGPPLGQRARSNKNNSGKLKIHS